MTIADTTLTRPVAPPASGWAALGTWFEAPTPHGAVQLYLGEAEGPATHAAAAALALRRAAPLLDLLDAWLGDAAPDWRWRQGGAARLGTAAVRLPWRDSCHQLIAPWRWLRALPAPPEALAARIQWPAMDAVLAISRQRLSAAEVHQLEPGGAVLLPESMRAGWTGGLRAATEAGEAEGVDVSDAADVAGQAIDTDRPREAVAAGIAVALDDPARPRVLPGGPRQPAACADRTGGRPGDSHEVRLHLRRTLPAHHLAGWDAEALHDAITAHLAASLWQTAAAREPARCLAHGRLLPWGDGWALLIDGLGEEAEQAHVSPA